MGSSDSRPIALVGLMGAGKTAVGRALARRRNGACADLDAMVAADAGCSIAELFEREGEPAFRARETTALERAIAGGAGVIACGGGVVLDARNRALLSTRCRTVWLEVQPREAARRMAAEPGRPEHARPVLAAGDPERSLSTLLAERGSRYAEVARWRIPTDGLAPDDVAEEILRRLDDDTHRSALPAS